MRRCARENALLAFDFDGTLAPIVPTPATARLTPEAERLLETLTRLYDVCVISGRGKADVALRVPPSVRCVIGNHGIEGSLEIYEPEDIEELKERVGGWRDALEASLRESRGVWIEDKAFSLSVHYRDAPDALAAEEAILAAARALSPRPRLVPGKCVFNVVPSELPHKGTALLQAMKEFASGFALFVGDDHTDEDVFALESEDILTVRVGSDSKSKALFHLDRQADIVDLMRALIALKNETQGGIRDSMRA